MGVFDALTALTLLDLQRNAISTLPLGVFDALSLLDTLLLSYNAIDTLPLGIFDTLSSLRTLWLNYNAISELPLGIFDVLTALIYLSLTGNAIDTLPPGIFDALVSLELLHVSANAISTLPPGIFATLTSLHTLGLSRNTIATLPLGIFDALVSLQDLILSDNSIATVPLGIFDALTSIEYFSLYGNPISTLPWGIFDAWTWPLRELRLPSTMPCVPLSQETISSLDKYVGSTETCETPECATGWTGPAGSCTQCPAGTYKATTGPVDCNNCEAGTYGSSPGSTTCVSCPSNSTASEGSDELTDCKCNDGFTGPDGGACVADVIDSPDDGVCVLLDVAGTTVCVPEHLTPAAAVAHCFLPMTWKQLRTGWSGHGYVTGGLGKLMVLDVFEVWLCAALPHPCAAPSDPVCFTYSEVNSVFVPWGLNSTLDLGRAKPSVVTGRRRSVLSSKPSP